MYILFYRGDFLAKNVVFRVYHKLDAGLRERVGSWELVPTNFGQISSNHGADYAQHKLKLVPTKIFFTFRRP